ncbi:uncharacterized protein LOC143226133 isoform X2 [Tachypleus tridentatus]|uniref:uncharacterized protein LOC143226133 isoform X2 n=1 Tax=Tachypleus tridentatus TaxID=6853 RepID=UPI003FD35503
MPGTAKMEESKSDGVPTAEGAEEVASSESGNSTVHVKDGESAKKTEPESTKIKNEQSGTEENSHQRNEQKNEDIPEEKVEKKTGNNPEQNNDKMSKEADDSAVEKPKTLEGTSNKRTHRFRSDQAACTKKSTRENEEPTATGKEKEKRSGKYEIVSIREKHSNFRKAVPLMPLPLSIVLCLLNVGIPGLVFPWVEKMWIPRNCPPNLVPIYIRACE